MTPRITVPHDKVAEFYRRWKITELAIFDSVLRDDFGPDSDVDVLLTFEPDYQWGWDELAAMVAELSDVFGGRRIDFVEKDAVVNPFRRHEIRTTATVLCAA